MASLTGVTQDSRAVEAGYLFAALEGGIVDGRDFIDDAITRGASVILSDHSVTAKEGADFISSDNPRQDFAHIVSAFYAKQPKHVIAVTGTNGKSSVVHFVDQLLSGLGHRSAAIGTLSGAMTTPDPVSLHAQLAGLAEDGITHVAMEASSHGLDQYRIDGVDISVAAFTSFSQDHLDYHETMDAYLSTKVRLFSEVLGDGGTAVVNADLDAYDFALRGVCQSRGLDMISYGRGGLNIKIMRRDVVAGGQDLELNILGQTYAVNLPLVGEFQAMNALCALGCVMALYPDDVATLVGLLADLEGALGRLQHVSNGELNAYVDYAHTPDALENVLNALRPHTGGRL